MFRRSVYVNLLKHRECHTVIQLTKLHRFLLIGKLLIVELVTRESEHFDTLIRILVMQLLQVSELLYEPALTYQMCSSRSLSLMTNGMINRKNRLMYPSDR